MKYGVVLPIWQLTVADAESLATKAEALGLDGVFVPDHILAKPATTQHYGGHWPDPFSLLAFLAGRTRRIQLGASVIVLPYRNALVAANKPFAMMEYPNRTHCICQGRNTQLHLFELITRYLDQNLKSPPPSAAPTERAAAVNARMKAEVMRGVPRITVTRKYKPG